jgi:hypothetical protein
MRTAQIDPISGMYEFANAGCCDKSVWSLLLVYHAANSTKLPCRLCSLNLP